MKTIRMDGAVVAMMLIGFAAFTLAPVSANAASGSASLGGGNALSRAEAGRSQGLTNANIASSILERLQFASTHGGQPDTTPPNEPNEDANQNASTGGNTSQDQSNGANGPQGANAPQGGEEGANNGGAQAGNGGNGGDGGDASPGGLVRAGNAVTSANAVNVLNALIIRFNF